MQNKPNFQKSQMNVNPYNTTDYENKCNWTLGESKPNSNPIKPNLKRAKMNVNLTLTKDYRKKGDFLVRKNKPNSNPISEKPKMNLNLYVIEDYENETTFRPQKNKPNSNPNKANFKRKDSLHKQCDLLYLKGSFVMEHLSRYWQTKLRKVVQKC